MDPLHISSPKGCTKHLKQEMRAAKLDASTEAAPQLPLWEDLSPSQPLNRQILLVLGAAGLHNVILQFFLNAQLLEKFKGHMGTQSANTGRTC